MKTILSIAMLTLTFPLLTSGSMRASAPTQREADPIATIRTRYAKINKLLNRFKKVKKDLSGFSAEGGELVAYLDGPAVAKMAATYFGEGGNTVEEYYFWNGDLIFVFRKESRYDRPLSGKVVSTKEDRCYFHNGNLIRWVDDNGKQVGVGSAEFTEKQRDFLESARHLVDGVRSDSKTIEAW